MSEFVTPKLLGTTGRASSKCRFSMIHGAPDTAPIQGVDTVGDVPKSCAVRKGKGDYRRTCNAVGVQVGG